MSKARLVTIVSIIGVVAILAVALPLTSAKAETAHGDHSKMAMKNMRTKPLSLEKIHSSHLPMVSKSMDKAIKAIEAGNKKTALAELHKAQKMLAAIKNGIGKLVKPKFANVRCPIMGSPIIPDRVTDSLIRDYKGQKIAFCCGGCPGPWDKLTDAEKDAKLAKVKPKPTEDHSMHKH
ncbi:MAG TPA: hypothetical protein ENH94_03355 [Phycisphaerales bacterium]|nr:hypothetical protein [Phycisphaerales bacterium]